MLANELAELDRAHLIHPVMSWRDHEARRPHVLASGEGAYLTDASGRTLLDGFAGLRADGRRADVGRRRPHDPRRQPGRGPRSATA